MIHDEVIEVLLRARRVGRGSLPSAAAVHAAEQHVVLCSDCWRAICALTELSSGDPPPGAQRVFDLYGCAPVRDALCTAADLGLQNLARLHPEVARHLGSCPACQGRYGELLAVEDAAARGEFEESPALPWREAIGAAAQRVYELAGLLRVELRPFAAAFAELPAGLVATSYGLPVSAMRGSASEPIAVSAGPPGQDVRLDLGDSGVLVRIAVERGMGSSLRLTVALEGEGGRWPMAVGVRRETGSASTLLVAQSTAAAEPLIADELEPGDYTVEVWETEPQRRFRVRLRVNALLAI